MVTPMRESGGGLLRYELASLLVNARDRRGQRVQMTSR
jgi:hypothetical protein